MGKKSRLKKEIRSGGTPQGPLPNKNNKKFYSQTAWERVWLWLIYLSSGAALFSPFIFSGQFYFPFVGPKGLFIMGCSSVAFFSWLILVFTVGKKYRPRLNKVLIVFAFFLLILIASTILGQDPSRSFWSKFERMTGLATWLHLFGLFLALSNTLKSVEAWKRFFALSVGIGTIISLMAIAEQAGVKAFDFSQRGGSTLGNTSFLGTYLLFNVFFAAYLFFSGKGWQKIIWASSTILAVLAIYFSHARAASWVSIGGLLLMGMLFWAFRTRRAKIKIVGRVMLAIGCLAVLAAIVMLFIPHTPVSDKFTAIATKSRPVNWAMAWKGFIEKPLFGWGLENYYLVFPKYFNPCLFTPECGGEIWFDRTHNIVLDTLVTSGVFGLVAYLGLLAVLITALYKSRQKDFWAFAALTSLAVAYFIQNLSVFDMPVSLLLFIMVLAFGSFSLNREQEGEEADIALSIKHKWPAIIVVIIFLISFSYFVIQPAKADRYTLKAIQAQSFSERLKFAQGALTASAAGKYQIRDFFAEQFMLDIQRHFQDIMANDEAKQIAKNQLDFLVQESEKTIEESPLDYSAVLKFAQIYNLYTMFDFSKAALAESYAREALVLSPDNPQGYWALAQSEIYSGKFDEAITAAKKAVDLEPRWFGSWDIAIQVARRSGNQEKLKEWAQQALDLALSAIEKNPDNLSYYQSAAGFASDLGQTEKAKEIAQRALRHNPSEWQNEFEDILGKASTTTP